MIKTPLGEFLISFNGKNLEYTYEEAKNSFGSFFVEKRFDIFCNVCEGITLKLNATNSHESFDSDESFSVKFWENAEYIVGIGVDCTYPELIYENFENSFFIKENKIGKLKIRLVWTKKNSENAELACWYGADPNYN